MSAPSGSSRRTVTVLFCDLVGSTSLGDRADPELLRELMARYHSELRTILERHGATVEKFVGDAAMAVFGIPQAHEDDALRAVRAADEIRSAVTRLGLEVRIGVNTGEVVAGHGETLPIRGGEEGYILPVNADPNALPLTAIPMDDVKRISQRLNSSYPAHHYPITAREARALGYTNIYAPIMDMGRDQRWGRYEDTYGEDPFLAGELGLQMVLGLQENYTVASTPKHFAVHGVNKGAREGEGRVDPQISFREAENIFNRPFGKVMKEGKALGVMASYNDYDGVPIISSRYWLIDRLRTGVNAVVATAWVAVGATVIFLVAAIVMRQLTVPSGVLPWLYIIGLGTVSTAVAFTLFLRGLQALGPVTAAIVTTTEPFFVATLAALFLDQPIQVQTIVGGALIALAVLLLVWTASIAGAGPYAAPALAPLRSALQPLERAAEIYEDLIAHAGSDAL